MKRLIFFAVAFALCTVTSGLGQPLRDRAFKQVMDQKLTCTQNVLEGLSLNDFKKVRTNAKTLLQLTNTEEWLAIKTPEYAKHTNEFRDSLDKMLKRVEERNLDGATLAYLELTLTCVRCHQYVREVKDVNWRGQVHQ